MKPRKRQIQSPVLDERSLLLNELNRFSTIIDQCFNWNVFSQNSRAVLNQTLTSIRQNILLYTDNRFSIFDRGILLVISSVEQYKTMVQLQLAKENTTAQTQQLLQLQSMMFNFLTSLTSVKTAVEGIMLENQQKMAKRNETARQVQEHITKDPYTEFKERQETKIELPVVDTIGGRRWFDAL